MKPKTIAKLGIESAALAMFSSASAATLITNNFDGIADAGETTFQQIHNGQGSVSTDLDTGSILTQTSNNASVGFGSTVSADYSAESSFTLDWVVSDTTGDVGLVHYNGWFFGVTNTTSSTATEGLGIVLDGGSTQSTWSFSQEYLGTTTATTLNGSQATNASFADGFTLSMTVNSDDTWSASSTGLSNDINASGTLVSGTYAAISDTLVVNTTIQGPEGGGVDLGYTIDSVTLSTIPEPSSAVLLGLAGFALIYAAGEPSS